MGRIASGQFGDFREEYLVACHAFEVDWDVWTMHPKGDEIVCLLSGSRIVPPHDVLQRAVRWHEACPAPDRYFESRQRAISSQYWCRLSESNGRPTVYKTVALPTELKRRELLVLPDPCNGKV